MKNMKEFIGFLKTNTQIFLSIILKLMDKEYNNKLKIKNKGKMIKKISQNMKNTKYSTKKKFQKRRIRSSSNKNQIKF